MNKNEFLIWLGGFIDGEGTITLHKARAQRSKVSGFSLTPEIRIYNCEGKSMKLVSRFLDSMGIHHGFYSRERRHSNWNKEFQIQISSLSRIEKLLKILQPYLIFKQERTRLLLKYIEKRKKRIKKESRRCPYNQEELQIALEIKRLNHVKEI